MGKRDIKYINEHYKYLTEEQRLFLKYLVEHKGDYFNLSIPTNLRNVPVIQMGEKIIPLPYLKEFCCRLGLNIEQIKRIIMMDEYPVEMIATIGGINEKEVEQILKELKTYVSKQVTKFLK